MLVSGLKYNVFLKVRKHVIFTDARLLVWSLADQNWNQYLCIHVLSDRPSYATTVWKYNAHVEVVKIRQVYYAHQGCFQ